MKLVFAALLLAIALPSYADDYGTGNELQTLCNYDNYSAHNSAWGLCQRIVGDINGAMFLGGTRTLSAKIKKGVGPADMQFIYEALGYCLPENVSIDQMGLVVSKYLKDTPAQLNWPNELLILSAFQSAWPCSTSKK